MKRILTSIWEAEPAVIAMAAAYIVSEVLGVLAIDAPWATAATAAATAVLALLARNTAYSPVTVREIEAEHLAAFQRAIFDD